MLPSLPPAMPVRSAQLLSMALALLLLGCAEQTPEQAAPAVAQARVIIAQAQAAHGSSALSRATVQFDFRARRFTAHLDDGLFHYTRAYRDESGRAVREGLTNTGLYRTIDGAEAALTPAEAGSLESALNSVVYFALLPRALTDRAVQPRLLGTTTIGGEPYHEVEVTFRAEGGGRDHEDRFVYWFHQQRHTLDYLAYYFFTGDGGGRFRKAINARTVGGMRFQDYLNYEPLADSLGAAGIEGYDELLESGGLRQVSDVVLENVRVTPLDG